MVPLPSEQWWGIIMLSLKAPVILVYIEIVYLR
jgi:hypothetical protein